MESWLSARIWQVVHFFNDKTAEKPELAAIMKRRYCLGEESTTCARYIVCEALGKENVPGTLFPNMQEKAQELITVKS